MLDRDVVAICRQAYGCVVLLKLRTTGIIAVTATITRVSRRREPTPHPKSVTLFNGFIDILLSLRLVASGTSEVLNRNKHAENRTINGESYRKWYEHHAAHVTGIPLFTSSRTMSSTRSHKPSGIYFIFGHLSNSGVSDHLCKAVIGGFLHSPWRA